MTKEWGDILLMLWLAKSCLVDDDDGDDDIDQKNDQDDEDDDVDGDGDDGNHHVERQDMCMVSPKKTLT